MSVQTDVSGVAAMVAGACAGDEAAFTRLVSAYHEDLVRVAFVITGDPDMASDAAQLAWNQAWRKLHSVRDPARVRSWLVAIAINEARGLVRRQRRRTVVEIRAAHEGGDGPATEPSASGVDLVNALGRLSPEDRELVGLRYVLGLDATEIASLRGGSPSGTRPACPRPGPAAKGFGP